MMCEPQLYFTNYLIMTHNHNFKKHMMHHDGIYTYLFSKMELLVVEAYVMLIGVLAKQLKQLLTNSMDLKAEK